MRKNGNHLLMLLVQRGLHFQISNTRSSFTNYGKNSKMKLNIFYKMRKKITENKEFAQEIN